jgi:hypothetical protein
MLQIIYTIIRFGAIWVDFIYLDPKAKFPGVVVFSEIYQGMPVYPFYIHTCFCIFALLPYTKACQNIAFLLVCKSHASHPLSIFYLYPYPITPNSPVQSSTCPSPFNSPTPVTGPVSRFARQIASQGYIVAAPSSYHEFTGPEPLAYDVPGKCSSPSSYPILTYPPTQAPTPETPGKSKRNSPPTTKTLP